MKPLYKERLGIREKVPYMEGFLIGRVIDFSIMYESWLILSQTTKIMQKCLTLPMNYTDIPFMRAPQQANWVLIGWKVELTIDNPSIFWLGPFVQDQFLISRVKIHANSEFGTRKTVPYVEVFLIERFLIWRVNPYRKHRTENRYMGPRSLYRGIPYIEGFLI